MRVFLFCITLLILTACEGAEPTEKPERSLAIGDSMFAWNALSLRSIPNVVEKGLGHSVVNASRNGARMIGGIPAQVKLGDWTHVLVNGGANDLIFRCGCSERCAETMDKMISSDGRSGIVPDLLTKLRDGGAQVSFVGYHRAREMNAPLRHCGPVLDQYEARIAKQKHAHEKKPYPKAKNPARPC